MKGEKRIIQAFNKVLANQLTAINQYFLHSRMLNDWGLDDLGEREYKASIKEMKNADKVIKRVLFLEGLPNLQSLNKLLVGETTEEIIQCDLTFERQAIPLLREAIALCEELQDYVSRDLLESILDDQEEHLDWLETQEGLIENMGLRNYIQKQA